MKLSFLLLSYLLLVSCTPLSENKDKEASMNFNNKVKAMFNAKVSIRKGENVTFEDGLEVSLTSFSHKKPQVGGSTKATAYLQLKKNDKMQELLLSKHGQEGDESKAKEEFDTKELWGYRFELYEFEYDRSITLSVKPAS